MNNLSKNKTNLQQELSKRARLLAQEEPSILVTQEDSLLVFYLSNKQKYAVEYGLIDRVLLSRKITSISNISPLFAGLIYYNSEVWPVINLNILFGCEKNKPIKNFILSYGKKYFYAFGVDEIVGQIPYDKSATLTQLPMGSSKKYIRGIYQTDIAFIEMSSILKLLETINLNNNPERGF